MLENELGPRSWRLRRHVQTIAENTKRRRAELSNSIGRGLGYVHR